MVCCRQLWTLALLAAASMAAAPAPGAASLLAKASAAYEQNILQEKHWNWTSTEIYRVTLKGGDIVARLPSVTIESVIRSDGQRCSAVLRWDDGVEAHLAKGDAESRCAATSGDRSALDLTRILKSRRVTLVSETAEGITLAITPDKDLLHAPEIEVRCSASLRVTLLMDAATFFPRRVEGEVVESGCDRERVSASVYYGGKPPAWVRDSLHKGATFRVEYELQEDKFQAPERSFWIPVREHYDIPRWYDGGYVIFWGRRFEIRSTGEAQYIVKNVETVAKEFGARSTVR